MAQSHSQQLLGALLSLIPVAEQARKHSDPIVVAEAERALAKSYGVLFHQVIANIDGMQDTWKIAARHNDLPGAVEWCAHTNEITTAEAEVLVRHFVQTCHAQSKLLDVPVAQTPAACQRD